MSRGSHLKVILLLIFIGLSVQVNSQVKNGEVYLAISGDVSSGQVSSFRASVNLNIKLDIRATENILNRYDANPIFAPALKPNPDLETFLRRSLTDFLVKTGFEINPSGLMLTATIEQFEINYLSGIGWAGSVNIGWKLTGSSQEELYAHSSQGFFKLNGPADNYTDATSSINNAYFQSLNQMDWTSVARIASKAEPSTQQQGNTRVQTNNQFNNTNNSNVRDNNREAVKPADKTPAITMTSDIDVNIPVTYQKNENTFAVVIGNENYDNEIQVKFAKNDARTFYEYSVKTLGIPRENIHLVENGTYGKMLGEIDWLRSVAKAYQGKAKLLFYYAGHGMPDESTKSAFLLPTDGSASSLRTAIKVEELYAALAEYPTQQVTVFLDACFSGAAREGMLASGRGVRIAPKPNAPRGNLIIFTAVSGDETAHPYTEKQHGLFSYYLMKKLQESKGDISLQNLSEYISSNVNKQSVVSGKEQNPTVITGPVLQSTWQNLKLK
jgi:hypothetical protein